MNRSSAGRGLRGARPWRGPWPARRGPWCAVARSVAVSVARAADRSVLSSGTLASAVTTTSRSSTTLRVTFVRIACANADACEHDAPSARCAAADRSATACACRRRGVPPRTGRRPPAPGGGRPPRTRRTHRRRQSPTTPPSITLRLDASDACTTVGRVHDRQHGGRRDAVHVVSECGVADQRQDPVARAHELRLRPGDDTTPSSLRRLRMNGNQGTKVTNGAVRPNENRVPQLHEKYRSIRNAKRTPPKGTTPARGGGGGGRRVSAPGGRADAHPA